MLSDCVLTACRGYLSLLSIVFLFLGIQMMYHGPATSLAPHGLDVSAQPASALAELRAYYGGTEIVLAFLFGRSVFLGTSKELYLGLTIGLMVLGFFTLLRVVSYYVDGAPVTHQHAYFIWSIETIGVCINLILMINMSKMKAR